MRSRGDPEATTTDLNPAELAQWQQLWLDFRFASRYFRPFKISLLHRWFSLKPYRSGDNPDFEARMLEWRDDEGSTTGNRRTSLDPSRDLSFTVLSLAKYLSEIRPVAPEALQDFANIQLSRDGESRGLMVPNHDAFDAFMDLYLSDDQIEALWKMVCDPDSPLGPATWWSSHRTGPRGVAVLGITAARLASADPAGLRTKPCVGSPRVPGDAPSSRMKRPRFEPSWTPPSPAGNR